MVVVLLLMSVLAVHVTVETAILQKSLQQSGFFASELAARHYANAGVNLALHDLALDISGNEGKIGTASWTTANDVGKDGVAGTADEGEGDGLPTAGEPNVSPASVGPSGAGYTLTVYTEDSAWTDVKRIVSTASVGDAEATVEVFAQATTSVPLPGGSTYVDPSVNISSYSGAGASGFDTNPDDTPGPEPATYGITTAPGTPPGSNATLVLSQIPSSEYGTITGLGGSPSVGEASSTADIDALFDTLKASATLTYNSEDVTDPYLGAPGSPEIAHIEATDATISSTGVSGAGILLIEAKNVTFAGSSSFHGLVIIRSSETIEITGNPNPRIYGQLIVGSSEDYSQQGNGKIVYSSQTLGDALDALYAAGGGFTTYTVVHRNNY